MTKNEKIVVAASTAVVLTIPAIALIKAVKGRVETKRAEKAAKIAEVLDHETPLA